MSPKWDLNVIPSKSISLKEKENGQFNNNTDE